MTQEVQQRVSAWRTLWRVRGLALDRLLPCAFKVPLPSIDALRQRVVPEVAIPSEGKQKLSQDDKDLVFECSEWVTGFVAEVLPVQVVSADLKLPGGASTLAVRAGGATQSEYIGSFDMVLRVRGSSPDLSGIWRRYDKTEAALDVKLTGASKAIGVDSDYVLRMLRHGHAVLKAADKDTSSPLCACAIVMYLLRRPPGPTFNGANHAGAFSLLVFDRQVFRGWDPKSAKSPKLLLKLGQLVTNGKSDGDACTSAMVPLASRVARAAQQPQDRWAQLPSLSSRRGWVTCLKFVQHFGKCGPSKAKDAAERVKKRMEKEGYEIQNADVSGKGRPPKMARISDLKRVFSDWS